MRPSLSIITIAALALTSMVAASPVDSVDSALVERSPSAASSPIGAARREPLRLQDEDAEELEQRSKHKAKVTYYTGSQLDNPACGGKTPNGNTEHIAAVKSGGRFKCGDRIKLKKGSKSVTVKVVDKCESCSTYHIDLSEAAFKKLGHLSEGVISGINWSMA